MRQAKDITDNAPLRGGKGMLYQGWSERSVYFSLAGANCKRDGNLRADYFSGPLSDIPDGSGSARTGELCFGRREYFTGVEERREARLEREALYWHFPGLSRRWFERMAHHAGWRHSRRRLEADRVFEDQRIELYNLKEDVGERHDLAKSQPQRAAALHEKLEAWRQENESAHARGEQATGRFGRRWQKEEERPKESR